MLSGQIINHVLHLLRMFCIYLYKFCPIFIFYYISYCIVFLITALSEVKPDLLCSTRMPCSRSYEFYKQLRTPTIFVYFILNFRRLDIIRYYIFLFLCSYKYYSCMYELCYFDWGIQYAVCYYFIISLFFSVFNVFYILSSGGMTKTGTMLSYFSVFINIIPV